MCVEQEPTQAGTNISQGAGCCISRGCQSYLCYGCSSPEGQQVREGPLHESIRYKGSACSGQLKGAPSAPTADPYKNPSSRHCCAAFSGAEQATDRQGDAVMMRVCRIVLCLSTAVELLRRWYWICPGRNCMSFLFSWVSLHQTTGLPASLVGGEPTAPRASLFLPQWQSLLSTTLQGARLQVKVGRRP